jgi:phosphatidylglycerol:prolipoprotein diacylglycerol transferase
MHSVLFEIGPLTIHWYGVMMAVAFLAGLVNWIALGRSRGRDAQFCSDLIFWVMVSGILGARLAYVLENWSDYAAAPLTILRLDEGGLIFYGGFAAAGVAILLVARHRKERFAPLLDFVLTSVPLSHAFGRIGCFLNGCCFGNCSELPQAVHFPKGAPAWMSHYQAGLIDQLAPVSLGVHPVQLYEAGYNLLIYGILVWLFRRAPRAGMVSAAYLLLYAFGRFVLEFFRGDRGERLAVGGLSIGQFASLVLFLVGLIVLVWLLVKRVSPAPEGR